MSLAPGTRSGPTRFSIPIGAGGMGKVYRAHDTRLGRDVETICAAARKGEVDAAHGR